MFKNGPDPIQLLCALDQSPHGQHLKQDLAFYLSVLTIAIICFLNSRSVFLLLTLASVLYLRSFKGPRVGGTHLNVMVCEFSPKFPACTEVQQGHLGRGMVKGMLGVHHHSPLSEAGGPQVHSHTVPLIGVPWIPGLPSPHFLSTHI